MVNLESYTTSTRLPFITVPVSGCFGSRNKVRTTNRLPLVSLQARRHEHLNAALLQSALIADALAKRSEVVILAVFGNYFGLAPLRGDCLS
jgi:hypothetical protein